MVLNLANELQQCGTSSIPRPPREHPSIPGWKWVGGQLGALATLVLEEGTKSIRRLGDRLKKIVENQST